MAVDYDLNKRLARLLPVLDEYAEWFGQGVRRVSYPESLEEEGLERPNIPQSFYDWSSEAQKNEGPLAAVVNLEAIHQNMVEQAEALMVYTQDETKRPSFSVFNDFVITFEEFVHNIRRLEKDFLIGERGVDSLTGLRSIDLLDRDFRRELDRTSRQGKPFSIALVRINPLSLLKQSGDVSGYDECMKLVADLIGRSIRSFDDAYRMDSDEVLLSFKQSNISGGVRALKRLISDVQKANRFYAIDGHTHALSLSSCVAEPMVGDKLENILQHMRKDIAVRGDDNKIVEYRELSPLQRYAQDAGS